MRTRSQPARPTFAPRYTRAFRIKRGLRMAARLRSAAADAAGATHFGERELRFVLFLNRLNRDIMARTVGHAGGRGDFGAPIVSAVNMARDCSIKRSL